MSQDTEPSERHSDEEETAEELSPDYGRGKRKKPVEDPERPDFARGVRETEREMEDEELLEEDEREEKRPDFARGKRAEEDTEERSDFARGQRKRD